MKKNITIVIILLFNLINISAQQKNNIQENIKKAKEKGGIEYNQDGKVKIAININLLESFYKWSETTDSTFLLSTLQGWDIESIRTYMENYAKLDISDKADVLRKYKNQLTAEAKTDD